MSTPKAPAPPSPQPANEPAPAAPPTPPSAAPPVKPIRAPDPVPNPLAGVPAPTIPAPKRGPGRPTKAEAAARAAAGGKPAPGLPSPAPVPGEPSRWRVLPEDPASREAALATVRNEAVLVLSALDVLAARLPPQRPLSDEERTTIQPPLEAVLYKYGANWPPEILLSVAVGSVALGRYMEVRIAAAGPFAPEKKKPDEKAEPKAA